jgi:hypothetical protein
LEYPQSAATPVPIEAAQIGIAPGFSNSRFVQKDCDQCSPKYDGSSFASTRPREVIPWVAISPASCLGGEC